jgi:hypothetical protein
VLSDTPIDDLLLSKPLFLTNRSTNRWNCAILNEPLLRLHIEGPTDTDLVNWPPSVGYLLHTVILFNPKIKQF